MILLLSACFCAGTVALWSGGGYGDLMADITHIFLSSDIGAVDGTTTPEAVEGRFGNILARGAGKELGSMLSVVLGVLSTQAYAQGIWAAKDTATAKKGIYFSALLTIPIGVSAILVGLYMRAHYVTLNEIEAITAASGIMPEGAGTIVSSLQAFPQFIIDKFPQFWAGIVLGTLFITIVGCGAGLALGSTTIVVRDIISHFKPELKNSVPLNRFIIIIILALGSSIVLAMQDVLINNLALLSMGLRATAIFVPLSCALFFSKKISSKWILTAMICGTISTLIATFAGLPSEPCLWGIGVSIILCIIGRIAITS